VKTIRTGIIFFLVAVTGNSQNFMPETLIRKQADFMTTDHLGNVYLICPDGLYQYNSKGALLHFFSDKSFGRISTIDASDPLKILIYNRDFRKAYLLDDKLSVQSVLNLDDLGIGLPELICTSRHDGYWVYDQQLQRLIKYNSNLQKIIEGEILSSKIENLNPDFITETSEWILMNNVKDGIILLDRYGTYFKKIPLQDISTFQAEENFVYYYREGKLIRHDLSRAVKEEMPIPGMNNLRTVRIEKNRLYALSNEDLQIYSF